MALLLGLQAYQLQHVGNPLPDFPLSGTHNPHGKGHVLIDGLGVNQPEILEHHADGTAQIRNLTLADSLQGIAVHMDGAGGGLQLAVDQLDNGGFAGAGGAYQKGKLSVLNLHAHTPEGVVTLRIGFYDIGKFNHKLDSNFQCNQIVTHCNHSVNHRREKFFPFSPVKRGIFPKSSGEKYILPGGMGFFCLPREDTRPHSIISYTKSPIFARDKIPKRKEKWPFFFSLIL